MIVSSFVTEACLWIGRATGRRAGRAGHPPRCNEVLKAFNRSAREFNAGFN